MSRFGDEGDYAVGNVFVNSFGQNTSDGVTGIKRTHSQNAARSKWMVGKRNGAGKRWMSKHGQTISVRPIDTQSLIDIGWHFGRDNMVGPRRSWL